MVAVSIHKCIWHSSAVSVSCLFPQPSPESQLLYVNVDYFYVVKWFVRFWIHLYIADVLDNVHSLDNAAKDSVLVVQPGLQEKTSGQINTHLFTSWTI